MSLDRRKLLVLAEGRFSPLKSKTANGAIAYLRDQVVAVIDSTKAGMTAQKVLGYGGDIPVVSSLEEGLTYQPTHLLIGIAPTGGRLPDAWRTLIKTALEQRLHILSGLHTILSDDPEFSSLAKRQGVTLTDYRKITPESEVVSKGTWRQRKAKVILTVGTDCNIGKMTTILQVHQEFAKRGLKADFVATGQTGMLIRGRGIPVDSIISDYTAGCIELDVDRSIAEGYEYVLVEGQGALTHMGYSGVTLGLIHGTMPDAMILCHQPTRVKDDYGLPLPDLKKVIRLHEETVQFFRQTKVVGIGVSSVGLSDDESKEWSERIERETGLPAVDTFRFGGAKLADAILEYFSTVSD
ncbi:MAG: DUF1611 domain-containing protein [Ignavibacteriales bacterium]|nr:DUF1611 domain-containing protein [Ignavibacteriales bacterium]MBI3005676.1 DUF1611 domain-containing protein [Ignavibacteriales bacterium]